MKKNMQKLLLVLLMSCTSLLSFAQQQTITGTVKDGKGNYLQGVTVSIKNGNSLTATNAKGQFSVTSVMSI